MSLKERSYSVLLVSASDHFHSVLHPLLPESVYDPVRTAKSVSAAKRAVAEASFDFVIINSPLPDETGIRFSIDAGASPTTVVLLLVKSDLMDEVRDKVTEHGVFTLPKPTSRAVMIQALHWMQSARERLRKFEKRTLSIEQKMEEIRLVNRAKWLLIERRNMTEPDAHRYIEKRAMDLCVSRRDIAEDIIKTYA